MPLEILANNKYNLVVANPNPYVPFIGAATSYINPQIGNGIIGATNESGLFIWCKGDITVIGVPTGGTAWVDIKNLKHSQNHSITVHWEDYDVINFRCNTASQEKVIVFPRFVTNVIDESDDNYVITTIENISDIPDLTDNEGKYLLLLPDENGDVVPTVRNAGSVVAVLSDTVPIITSVSAPTSLINSDPSVLEFNKELVVEIKGYQFEPESKVFLFESSTEYYDLYNFISLKEYKTDTVGDITTDYLLNRENLVDVKSVGFSTTETGKVAIVGDVDGLTYCGYKNPETLAVKFNLIKSNTITEGSYVGKTYSVVVQNPNGEIGVLDNCMTISQTGATQMKFDTNSVGAGDSLYGEADLYNNNIYTDPDNLPTNVGWNEATDAVFTEEAVTLDPTINPNGIKLFWQKNVIVHDVNSGINNLRIYKAGFLYGDYANYTDLNFSDSSPASAADFLVVWHKTTNQSFLYYGDTPFQNPNYYLSSDPSISSLVPVPEITVDGIEGVFNTTEVPYGTGENITYYIKIIPITPPSGLPTEGDVIYGYTNPDTLVDVDLATWTTKADLSKSVRGVFSTYESSIENVVVIPL